MEPFLYQHNKGQVSVKAPIWFALLLILLMVGALSWSNRQAIGDILARLGRQDDKIAEISTTLDKQDGRIANLSTELDLAIVDGFGGGGQAGTDGAAGADGANGSDGTDGANGATGSQGAAGADGADGTNSCIASTCVSLQASSPGLQEAGSINIDGSVLAADFQGSGADLTDLNASEITTGSLADGRLSSNVALLNRSSQTFIGTNLFKPSVDSGTALQVQNAAGTAVLTVDTMGQTVQLNGFGPIFAPTLAAGANTGGTLRGDTTYYYQVTAIDGGGESLPSPQASFAPISFTPLSPPAAPTATVTGNAGNPNGTYTYKVTFITKNGETTPSAASNTVTPTSDQVDLSFATGPAGTVQRRLWRTTDGGSTYFLVANIMDNTTTTYTDNLADAGLGVTIAPTTNRAFTNTNNIEVSFASVPGATSYRVYRSTTPNGHGTYFNTAGSPFTDSGNVGTVSEAPEAPAAVTVSAGLAVANLANCQRVQTDANGTLLCGTGGELYLPQIEVWGHSLADGSGASVQYGTDWAARLSAMLHAQDYNRAVGGSVASYDNSNEHPGGYAAVLQAIPGTATAAPYLPRVGAAIIWYGLNDMAYNGNTVAYKEALRTIIARNQAAAVFEDSDSSMVFAAGGGPAWSTVNDTEVNSGSSYRSAGGNGNTYTISVPSDFPGGTVDVGLIATGDGDGAVHSFSIDGGAAGSIDTRNLGAENGYKTGVVKRFANLAAGAHTIVGTISAFTGSTYVDYWQIESVPSRLTLVVKQFKPATYTLFTATPFPPTDEDIDDLNSAIDEVTAEFDGSVLTVATEAVINRNPSYLTSDNVHLNDLGHAKITVALYEALARVPVTPQQLAYASAAVNNTNNNVVFKNSVNSTSAFQIQPASSATPVFNVDTTNARIGIGTATPLYTLDLRSTSTASQIHLSSADVDSGGYLLSSNASTLLGLSGASYDGANFIAKAANATIFGGSAGTIAFYTDGGLTIGNSYTPTQRLLIQSTGNVGINTASPDRKLDVLDASNPQLRLTQADGTVYTDLQTTSSGYLSITPSGGNTGLGTTTPGYKLDIRGSTIPQIHIAATDVDSGGYLFSSAANNVFTSGGSAWNGSGWTAKAAQSNIYAGSAGSATIYLDTGLTIGNTFTPTARLTLNTAGATFADDLAVNGGDLTTNQNTFNLLNATATTINLGAAATALNLGANTGTTSVDNNLFIEDRLRLGVDARTIADNGAGTSATLTLTPGSSYVRITCNDANGCDITMAEGSATDGDTLVIVNVSANAVNFANSAGVSQLSATPFAAGQYDNISFLYVTDRWIETARSNNL